MAEATPELRALLDSAELAASVQDFASAEQLLRQAASLQEAQLGPNHPDLANTLNNLGIVCERTGNSTDAEACYRRAYGIARSMLPAEDPLVLTSGQNLKDFCAATGRPFDPTPAPPIPPPPASQPAPLRTPSTPSPSASEAAPPRAPSAPAPPASEAAPPRTPTIPAPPAPQAAPSRAPSAPAPPAPQAAPPRPPSAPPPAAPAPPPVPFRSRAPVVPSPLPRVERGNVPVPQSIGVTPVAVPVDARAVSPHRSTIWVVVGIGLLLALVILLASRWTRSSEAVAPVATSEAPRAEGPPSEPPPPSASAAATEPAKTAPPPRSTDNEAARKSAATETRSTTASRPAATKISLVESQICRSLNNWRCTPATTPAEPGVFIFYTRVKSARDTTVQHRWYLNGTLRRTVDLRVAANPGEGYRTYSRNTVAAERRGNWTIELRDADGALLHEERFVVQ